MQINTNLSSLNAQRAYQRAGEDLSVSMRRLSSGQRINSAADDAAGLAISERLTAGVRGLDRAGKNVNDGISLLQVAEGALAQVAGNFQRIRELAVQAANDTNSDSDRRSLQQEADGLVSANLDIAAAARFNGQDLLDGGFITQLQVGAQAQQTIALSIPQLFAPGGHGPISVDVAEQQVTLKGQALAPLKAGALSINRTVVGAAAAGAQPGQGAASAFAVAAAVNAAAPKDVTASAVTVLSGAVPSRGVVPDGEITLNGVGLNGITGTSANALAAAAEAAINGAAGATGVTAVASGTTLTLTAADGRDIEIASPNGFAGVIGMSNGVHRGSVTLQDAASGQPHSMLIGGSNPRAAGFSAGSYAATATGNIVTVQKLAGASGEPPIELDNFANATEALDYVDRKLDDVNAIRAYLGATQSRLQQAYGDTASQSANLEAARGRIRDTDYASETARLTRQQILQQAGASMVAQANALPQQALQLLR
jgi:flagellin